MLNSRQHQGHFAHKRFGQNFLVDLGVIDSIVKAIHPERGERMVEIGPGLGALTGPVIERLATPESPLYAVELDRNLVRRLKQRFGARLELHSGDALAFDFGSLALPGDKPSLRIIGNLPYNISSPLLFHLMDFAESVVDQHCMLQNELVERMVAEPGNKAFSRLSVMLQYRYVMDKLIDVPPESFQPPPKVDSAIVRMIPYATQELAAVDVAVLGEVVTAAFSQRRKMLRNALCTYRDAIGFEALGFDLARRADEVGVDEYVGLAQAVSAARSAG
ncbi:MAG: 16S rRNA (adenine(1518)-N(6)/adenine(1519)-N(6))-dimethyltransferase RsmA [Burkholderia sp.]|nr:MAG: Ribosomal RNA small subunit methyltransferase A [Burkholderia gladioli]